MKIEEAKKEIKVRSKAMTDINAINSFGHIPCKQAIPVNDVIDIIDQIETDQPKPVIPQFVADWIEKYKEKRCRLYHALEHVFDDVELGLYIKQQEDDYTEIIAKAWLYGYTVEKEKLYTVEIPNPNAKYSRIVLQRLRENALHLKEYTGEDWKGYMMNQLTEAEIRKDFDWAWQWAKEVTE